MPATDLQPGQAKPAISQNEMIRASAGSGKTFQLTNRYIGLMAHGVDPEKIIRVNIGVLLQRFDNFQCLIYIEFMARFFC